MISPILVGVAMMGAAGVEDPRPPADRAAARSAYEAAEKTAGRDAKAQVRLALWCEAHGMTAERMKHLALAVLYDPSNALARGLMGLVAYQGKWRRPEEVSRQVQDDPGRQAVIREYLQRRAKTPDKADDQWKLALWCEQNGLKDQAIAHYHAVLRLNPARQGAWQRLGFKKIGGRWVKPEQLAAARLEAERQHKANKHWKPLLEKWGAALAGRDKNRRAEAETGLAAVSDPRAVPAIWAVFVLGGLERQKLAVRLLGQVDSPGSSRALALLALMSPSAEVRRNATQTLRRRDPRDFAPLLIGLLRDPIKYEVRPVTGPESTGELLIKDKAVNVRRLYSPPPPPNIPVLPGDSLSYDAAGLPVINRFLGQYSTGRVLVPGNTLAAAATMFGLNSPNSSANQAAQAVSKLGLPPAIAGRLEALLCQGSQVPVSDLGGPVNRPLMASEILNESVRIPIGQMMLESQKAAWSAEQQLEADVQALTSYNASVMDSNRRVRQVLADAIGTDLGAERKA